MQLNCPRCGVEARELVECESCKTIGCIKCIVKYNKQWVCERCKTGEYQQQTEAQNIGDALSGIFG